jgi:glycyl-tRNA synthetase beta chain
MVGEFSELQGVMGRYYATADGEAAEVAAALDEYYRPRFGGDAIASGAVARVLAVAERLDTLAGIFVAGEKPTGNKDPFALRRAALGLARTLIEGALPLDLPAFLDEAVDRARAALGQTGADSTAAAARTRRAWLGNPREVHAEAGELYDFILERLRGYYAEQGIGAEAFEAVRAQAPADLGDFDRRVRAVVEFARLPEAAALAAANKRIGNLLRQADDGAVAVLDPDLLEAGAEQALAAALAAAEADTGPLAAAGNYVAVLKRLAALRDPVDRYLQDVLVMAPDPALRANRLALLARVQRQFLAVADIGRLAGV